MFQFDGIRPTVPGLHKQYFAIIQKENGNQIVCVCFFRYDTKKKTCGFLLDHKSINNFVYNSVLFKPRHLEEILDYLNKSYRNPRFELRNVDSNTLLYKYLIEEKNVTIVNEPDSVGINLPTTYDEYYSSLSKSTRQNIRTAYNRLATDNADYHFVSYMDGQHPSLDVMLKVMYVQRKRNIEKGERSYGKLTDYLCKIAALISLSNPRVSFLKRNKKSFIDILYINGKIASFVGGYIDDQGRYYIPFLKFNSEFSRYSPGGLIICDSIKTLLADNKQRVKYYDLMTGSEQYKFTYGGAIYTNVCISFNWRTANDENQICL